MTFIPANQVEWRDVKILKLNEDGPLEDHPYQYHFQLPEPLASWDVFDYWERERFNSMRDNLKNGMVLFDIGTEQGWCNLVYAQFVGPENMVLIEPTREFWPNIKATWEKNGLAEPLAYYDGLFSDSTNDMRETSGNFTHWPHSSDGDLIDRNKYQYIHENTEDIPEITLDEYVKRTGITPDALTMDVEGAELLILRGAEATLKTHRPLVWVSVHPDLGFRDYQITREMTLDFMGEMGYKGTHLATDHEEHWFFQPGSKV